MLVVLPVEDTKALTTPLSQSLVTLHGQYTAINVVYT